MQRKGSLYHVYGKVQPLWNEIYMMPQLYHSRVFTGRSLKQHITRVIKHQCLLHPYSGKLGN